MIGLFTNIKKYKCMCMLIKPQYKTKEEVKTIDDLPKRDFSYKNIYKDKTNAHFIGNKNRATSTAAKVSDYVVSLQSSCKL